MATLRPVLLGLDSIQLWWQKLAKIPLRNWCYKRSMMIEWPPTCVIQEKKNRLVAQLFWLVAMVVERLWFTRGAASLLDPADIPVEAVEKTGWVHLSSIAGRLPTLTRIFLREKQKLSWNPGKQELLLLAESRISLQNLPVEVLLVNEQEWAMVDIVQPALQAMCLWLWLPMAVEEVAFYRKETSLSLPASQWHRSMILVLAMLCSGFCH